MLAPAGSGVVRDGTAAFVRPLPHPETTDGLSAADRALLDIGQYLRQRDYRFTTITPATHRRVLARAARGPATLRDVFGWTRSFQSSDLPEEILAKLDVAGVLQTSGGELRSGVRFSTLGPQLFMHSAFPTDEADAVFFGPDTYRFARAIAQCIASAPAKQQMRILDIGAGSGAGGLHAAALLASRAPRIVLTDINERALRFARLNAALNRTPDVQVLRGDLYDKVDGRFDLIISNPPYLVDPLRRSYRHGGGGLGAELSLRIAEEGLARLAPGGRLLLYTGSAIVDGVDLFHAALRERLRHHAVRLAYEEIDPDVFGEELDAPPYDKADRIAAIAATIAPMLGDR